MAFVPSQNRWYLLKDAPVIKRYYDFGVCPYYNKLCRLGRMPTEYTEEIYDITSDSWSTSSYPKPVIGAAIVTFQGYLYAIRGMEGEDFTGVGTVRR